MRSLVFYISILIILSSCTSRQESSGKVPQAEQTISVALNHKDTLPPSRSNYIVEQSRPAKDIKAVFPFDIDLKRADGSTVSSSEVFKKNDRPVVLLFWLTTCYPCRLEMKAIEKHYAEWQKEQAFDLYAVSTDFQKNFPSFTKMVNKSNWPWESFNDHRREFRQIMPGRLNGLPQLFVLDKQGNITYHKRRYQPGDEQQLFEEIKKAG